MAPSRRSAGNIYADQKQAADHAREYCPEDGQFRSHLVHQLLDAPSAHTLCDVVLRTNDGHDVPACRALLAANSQYFRSMFYSNFEEAKQKTVQLDVTKPLLHHMLHFVYTGHCPFLEHLIDDHYSSSHLQRVFCKHDELPTLVELCKAAEYHGLTLLHTWCDCTLLTICAEYPTSACAVLQAMHQTFSVHPSTTNILKLVRNKCRTAFNIRGEHEDFGFFEEDGFYDEQSDTSSAKNGILELSAAALMTVVSGDIRPDDQEYFFQAIFYWVTNGTALTRGLKLRIRETCTEASSSDADDEEEANSGDTEQHVVYVDEERMRQGISCASKLDLECMRLRFVHDYVIPTGLIGDIDFTDMLWKYVLSTSTEILVLD